MSIILNEKFLVMMVWLAVTYFKVHAGDAPLASFYSFFLGMSFVVWWNKYVKEQK